MNALRQWRLRRRAASMLALAIFAPIVGALSAATSNEPLEYKVRAAFLLNFTRFVEWPSADAGTPFAICVYGDDPFGRALDQIVEGETVAGRQIVVRHVRTEIPKACGILYIPAQQNEVREALSHAGAGVLTVGEGDEFLDQGGMVAFIVENRRVRFDVDRQGAMKSGLKLSSRLLKVARIVR